ncbi:MAG: RNA-binding protein [Bacteroidales bacterium]|nr:RNA-binding protein [Bacteroidales bacterium]
MNIYVGNLDFRVEENELEELFSQYGRVSTAKVITDKYSGKSKGFGFVEMEQVDEARNAIKELSGTVYKNREIIVNIAKEKKEVRNQY